MIINGTRGELGPGFEAAVPGVAEYAIGAVSLQLLVEEQPAADVTYGGGGDVRIDRYNAWSL